MILCGTIASCHNRATWSVGTEAADGVVVACGLHALVAVRTVLRRTRAPRAVISAIRQTSTRSTT